MFHSKSKFLYVLIFLIGVISTYNLEKSNKNDLTDHSSVLSNGILINNDANELSNFREKRMAPLKKRRMKNKLNRIKNQKQKEIEAHKRNERHLQQLLNKQQKQREAAKRQKQKQHQLIANKKAIKQKQHQLIANKRAMKLRQLKEQQLKERLRRDEERIKKLELIHKKINGIQTTAKPHIGTKANKVLPNKKSTPVTSRKGTTKVVRRKVTKRY